MAGEERLEWDYVVVGSGAGGGTLASRLVESGMRVFVLEAGGDPMQTAAGRLPDDYEVPAFHAYACENPAMSWDFKVRHYADEQRQVRDPKYEQGQGVLYPRAAVLGGCTAHNAMIFILPHESDWDHIAQVTGDRSWCAPQMRRYAQRLEACHHRPVWRALRRIGFDLSGHGWDGWLRTERAMPHEAMADDELVKTVVGTARNFASSLPVPITRVLRWMWARGDPNARRWGRRSYEGICYTPMSTHGHRRVGTRERLLKTAADHPGKLHIELDALATRLIFAQDGSVAGVEYLKGKRLYRAHAAPGIEAGARREVRARHEVILCGGAFNTPQLLMLSGIGPAQELQRHGIAVRADLPGVGRNLQDRYEVAVTHRMQQSWKVLAGARFDRDDPLWRLWHESRSGMYTSNGAALAIACRSRPSAPEPDIFCMALLARFEGYFSGFSKWIGAHQDYLTWAVLKAHTLNRAGSITLRSTDPRDTPLVNFNYFEDGSDATGEDLQAVVDGIKFVRRMTAPLVANGLIAEEKSPGVAVNTDAQLADYVRDTAWGHHASCSCAIGPASENGVLDSDFSVHGVRRLRVVDASVFPRIPGFFVASAVYMIGEKAADVILRNAARAR
ncbi:MAG TPA: GMC oxidoreductase [Burkholderiales bacterium]|nr:GMC oxidoreductase [Burkholderiales bacterium]